MKLIEIPPSEAHRITPLLQDLHALHVLHQPSRHLPDPDPIDLSNWLAGWLSQNGVVALAAESPQEKLLGYLIFEIEQRSALRVRAAEIRAMVHHIAVDHNWQRMGVGRLLMSGMKDRAVAAGATTIATTYAPFNAASAALMQSVGLEPVNIMAELRL
ncbi:MAG: GNAT family N-acetyltransferase [Paracoccaceae bacterium]